MSMKVVIHSEVKRCIRTHRPTAWVMKPFLDALTKETESVIASAVERAVGSTLTTLAGVPAFATKFPLKHEKTVICKVAVKNFACAVAKKTIKINNSFYTMLNDYALTTLRVVIMPDVNVGVQITDMVSPTQVAAVMQRASAQKRDEIMVAEDAVITAVTGPPPTAPVEKMGHRVHTEVTYDLAVGGFVLVGCKKSYWSSYAVEKLNSLITLEVRRRLLELGIPQANLATITVTGVTTGK